MILRDMYCTVCGRIQNDVECTDVTKVEFCRHCRDYVKLQSVCNGGLKSRYRMNDWPSDPLWYSGQTDSTVSANEMCQDGSEKPVEHKNGGVIAAKFMDKDRRGERRDKIRYRMRRRSGKTTIYSGAN